MTQSIIYSFIKTTCGREKYEELAKKEGLIARIRLGLFVVFASIRDWKIKTPSTF